MKVILITLAISLIIVFIEVPSLLERGLKKEFNAFFILLFFADILIIVKGFNINVPNPMNWLTYIYSAIIKYFLIFIK